MKRTTSSNNKNREKQLLEQLWIHMILSLPLLAHETYCQKLCNGAIWEMGGQFGYNLFFYDFGNTERLSQPMSNVTSCGY